MPNQNTDDQSDDQIVDDLEAGANDGTDDADDAASAGSDSDEKAVAKRISDLQSKADKAEARANKLQKELDAKAGGSDEGAPAAGTKDPEREAWEAEVREDRLDAVYGEYEELKRFGIDRALIGGRTRAEMRESATALVALLKSVETKVRNATLKEHGINAAATGATRQPPKNYNDMSAEEFEKEIAKARGGGSSLW